MKIANSDLEKVLNVLYDFDLFGKESRMRTKLHKMLQEKFQEFTQNHAQLIVQYSNKDEKGNPKIIGDVYDLFDPLSFNKEFSALRHEFAVIDEIESNSDMLKTMKEVVISIDNDADKKFSKEQAEGFDILYEALDSVTSQ